MSAAAEGPAAGVPDAEVDRLYGLPLEDFTRERDALAKRLRGEGDREAADAVRALRKPTLAAWAANQALRTQPKAAREFLAAGEALRAAQSRMLAGEAGPDELQEAADAERAATRKLVAAVRGLLTGAGRSLGESTIDRVTETLHAATLDDEARAEVEAGRVTREHRATGLGPFAAGAPSAPAKRDRPPSRAKPAERPRRRAGGQEGQAARRTGVDARAARAELREARHAEREAKRRLRAAERGAAAADREREQAEAALAEAKARLEAAASAAAEAAGELERARAEHAAAEKRVGELERRAER